MIAKRGVTCIHDIVTALLSLHQELPHFHFCEALFKPFENLLCLELCDHDIQDQVCHLWTSNRSNILKTSGESCLGLTTDLYSKQGPNIGKKKD